MRNPVRRPLALALLLAAAALVGVARPAGACTCAPFDTRSALSAADAALVGTFVSRADPPVPVDGTPAGETVYTFRVDTVVKGALGSEVEVRSASSEASCGLSVAAGRPVGLLLSERDGHYHGNLCSQPSPERLLRAAEPLPAPEGRLPPWVVVGSTYGIGRSVALDDDGQVAGVGTGAGTTTAVAVCPERERVVELFTVRAADGTISHGLTVRRLDTMAGESERLLPAPPPDATGNPVPVQLETLACRNAAGTDVVVFARSSLATGDRGRILHIVPAQDPATLWEGPAPRAAAFGPGGATAYLNLAPAGEEVVALALDVAGEPRSVVRVPAGSGPMVASADGRRLATVAVGSSRASQVVTVDLGSSPPVVATADLGGAGVTGDVQWTDTGSLVFMPTQRPAEAVRIYDPGLAVLASWAGWTAEHSVVVGSRLYGASQGIVRSAPLTTGPGTVVRELEDALMVAVVDVSTPAAVESAATTPPSTTSSTAPPPAPSSSSTSTTTTVPRKPAVTTTTAAPETTTTTTAAVPEGRAQEPPVAAGKGATKGGGGGFPGALWLGGAVLVLAGGAVAFRIRRRS